MPYIHFTEEQKHQANEVDLVEFLCSKGEPLIRSGPEFRMSSNHSVTVIGNEWYDHATEKGGGPVSFLKEFYGMNYQQAVVMIVVMMLRTKKAKEYPELFKEPKAKKSN